MAYNIEDTFLSNSLLQQGNIPYTTSSSFSPSQEALNLLSQGAPLEIIIAQTGLTADQINELTQRPVAAQTPPDRLGLDSLLGEQNTEIENLVEQGLNVTQVANDAVKSVGGPDLNIQDRSVELKIAEDLEKLGVDADTVALDEADDLLTKLNAASVAGSAGDAVDDENSDKTLKATLQIADNLDPEDQLEVYKEAAKLFYNTDDIKKLVPEPDKTLPFLVAGASLIQSGENDESWGSALSKAFLGYAGQTAKEKKAFQKTISDINIKEQEAIQNFAANMYIADRKAQQDLQKQLLTAEKSPYKVEGIEGVTYLSNAELTKFRDSGYNITPYSVEDGKVQEYTIYQDLNKDGFIDSTAPGKIQLMTPVEAQNFQKQGAIVREGNLIKNRKSYNVDGQLRMFNDEEFEAFRREYPNVDIQKIGTASVKSAINRITGEIEFVPNSVLMSTAGREKYMPVQDGEIIFGPDGQPVYIKGNANLGGAQGQKNVAAARITFTETDQKVANVLRGHFKITKILDDAAAAGNRVLFGTTGQVGLFAKRLDDELNSIQQVFTASGSDYKFFNDANNNNIRDPGEEISFEQFRKNFSAPEDSGIFKYLSSQGLDKKRIDNLVFTLALNSAALNNQKGRDISDKDMERNLRRAGAFATSEEEFRMIIDDLALEAVQHGQNIIDSTFRYDQQLPDGKGGFYKPITQAYPDLQENYGNRPAFSGAPYTINELVERLNTSTGYNPNAAVVKNKQGDDKERIIPEEGRRASGYGTSTIDDIAQEYKNIFDTEGKEKAASYLARIRQELGVDSPEFLAIKQYIQSGN